MKISTPMRRRRIYLAGAVTLTMAAGLASRHWPGLLPAALGKYPGDALWAQMVYWLVAFAIPAASVRRVTATALALAYLDEFSQLYQAAWINDIRATTMGHLVLGSTFAWADLLAYTIGIGLCGLVELLLFRDGRGSK